MRIGVWVMAVVLASGFAVGSMIPVGKDIVYGLILGIVIGGAQAWMLYRALDRWVQGRARGIGWGMRLAVHIGCIALIWQSAVDIAWWAVCIGIIGVPWIVAMRMRIHVSQK